MPNIKSAIKRMRQEKKRRARNSQVKKEIRTYLKKTRSLISDNNGENVEKILRTTFSKLDKAAKSGIIHKNKANRLKSKLAKQLVNLKKEAK
ncbi:MAG TPA: 30S ribosomal protein S20 [bacterium]|nr:30S ribosomal protein S20 [bacterium]HOL47092.1 30S ribosomal protein S20 [bacterium]HPQ18992.1 30S ribosomal protein S20 [bacterium]